MAITKVQHATANISISSTSLTVTLPSPSTAGNSIILFLAIQNVAGTVSATGFTIDSDASGIFNRGVVLSKHNAAAGISSITVTYPTSSGASIIAVEFSGLATSSAFDKQASVSTTGETNVVTPAIATTNANEILIGAFAMYSSSTTFTAGAGYTAIAQAKGSTLASNGFLEFKTVSATGSYTATATISASDYGTAQIVAYKATDTAPVTPTYPICTIASTNKTKISDENGMSQCAVTFKFDKDIQAYSVRLLGTSFDTGTVVDSGTGTIAAGTPITAYVDWNEGLSEGNNRINIYGQAFDGTWTAYGS